MEYFKRKDSGDVKMNKEELIEETLNLPKKIYDAELDLIETFDNFNKLNESVKEMELTVKNKIVSDIDDKGKQKFTNETMREARFFELSSKMDSWKKLNDDKLNLQKEINVKKAKLEFLKNDFSANKAILKVFEEGN